MIPCSTDALNSNTSVTSTNCCSSCTHQHSQKNQVFFTLTVNFQPGVESSSPTPNSSLGIPDKIPSSPIMTPIPPQLVEIQPNDKVENTIENYPLAKFMRFLKHIKLKKLLAQIADPRNPKKVDHKVEIILQWVLSVFFFRCASANALQTAFDKLPRHRKAALWNFFGLPEDSKLPDRTVVTDCLSVLNYEEINDLLEKLFKWVIRNKIIYNHSSVLLPGNFYNLACDGFWVHRYTTPHAKNELGENSCPYCLPRVHNKGKENEYTDYLHAFVNFAFIFPGGLQLPLYIYPLKAEQLQGHEAVSEEKHKQESELQAAQIVLPIIKEKFQKLPIRFLSDSLYANEPMIKLICEPLNWEYLIVRQEGSLKNVAKQCDNLENTEIYQTNYTKKEVIKLKNGGWLERTYKWFNCITVGKVSYSNVLRFKEIEYNADGSISVNEKGNQKIFKTEWLSSIKITKNNCVERVKFGRMRADHEDLHNSLKNRGYAAKHDYARANPNACLIWKLAMFVAFFIFEIFSFTKLAQESKGVGSWIALGKELLADLTKVPWDILSLSPCLQKENMQFRFNFSQ